MEELKKEIYSLLNFIGYIVLLMIFVKLSGGTYQSFNGGIMLLILYNIMKINDKLKKSITLSLKE